LATWILPARIPDLGEDTGFRRKKEESESEANTAHTADSGYIIPDVTEDRLVTFFTGVFGAQRAPIFRGGS
jgi:hypothetical protein